VKVLAGNKCECSAAQRAVDKERGEKVNINSRVISICDAIKRGNFSASRLDGVSRHQVESSDSDYVIDGIFPLASYQIAENFDMPFFEVSCKQNINIEECFLTLARSIREQREHRVT
jgi:Rab family, other